MNASLNRQRYPYFFIPSPSFLVFPVFSGTHLHSLIFFIFKPFKANIFFFGLECKLCVQLMITFQSLPEDDSFINCFFNSTSWFLLIGECGPKFLIPSRDRYLIDISGSFR